MADSISRIGRLMAQADGFFYVDVSPLIEQQWTGIPVVAAGLARALVARLPERTRFFLDLRTVDGALVQDALRRNTGVFLQRDIATGNAITGTLPALGASGPTIGIFPSVKRVRRAFDIECSVFHDLSTLVMPQFHTRATVDHHMAAMGADIDSDDLIVAVSDASGADLAAYFGVPEDRIAIAPNGVSWPDWYPLAAANSFDPGGIEPYFLILGTREPRKNVLLVFELLERAPQLMATHRFVFAGRMGWLEEQHALPPSLEPAVASGRILFTGFVSDFQKYKLLAGAEATLYPSLFEGFGLPVLESLSAGTPCVASFSSSIPEVGGELCCYFDPLSAEDFFRAIRDMKSKRVRERTTLSQACRDRAAVFTWESALARIFQRLERVLHMRAPVVS
jgi:glycosyltransferase involved in cell wall biosynthesis